MGHASAFVMKVASRPVIIVLLIVIVISAVVMTMTSTVVLMAVTSAVMAANAPENHLRGTVDAIQNRLRASSQERGGDWLGAAELRAHVVLELL
jgi:hypothetical protein